jgi:hypothetical protein
MLHRDLKGFLIISYLNVLIVTTPIFIYDEIFICQENNNIWAIKSLQKHAKSNHLKGFYEIFDYIFVK